MSHPGSGTDRLADLDPDVRTFLETAMTLDAPDLTHLSVEQARAALEGLYTPPVEPEPVRSVADRTIPAPARDIRLRIYDPDPGTTLPAVVYFHGGGWIAGNVESHDSIARELARHGECVVVSVDYRKALEHPFPAAVEDAYLATRWVSENASDISAGGGLAVVGDSAGGTLAAAVAQLALENTVNAPSIDHQLLCYPATNSAFDTASYAENADGFALTTRSMVWFWTHYLRDDIDGLNPLASPLRAPESVLSALPPATVITCEFDPLRDDGVAYVTALENAGVSVEHGHYDDLIHDIANLRRLPDPFPDIKAADRVLERAGAALRDAFG
jgi:acetyl esterase